MWSAVGCDALVLVILAGCDRAERRLVGSWTTKEERCPRHRESDGHLLWSLIDKSGHAPSFDAAQGEAFYFVGAGLDGHDSLSIIRGR